MSLPRYGAYKPSDVEWLAELPIHWGLSPLKYIAHVEMGQSPSSSDCNSECIGLPFLQGCAEFTEIHPQASQWCESPPKLSALGDILLSVRAPVGEMNFADKIYGIGRGLCAIRPNDLTNRFIYYVLTASKSYMTYISSGSTYQAVSVADVANLPIPVPSSVEQKVIAEFLDQETAAIDALVGEQRRLVALLAEKRRAVIARAVTRGLDPAAPLRPSGVPWLGDVPRGWEVRRVGDLCRLINGYPYDSRYFSPGEGRPLIRIRDIGQAETVVGYTGPEGGQEVITGNDVLIGMDGDFNVGRWRGEEPALLNQRVCCLRTPDANLRRFIEYAIVTPLNTINELTYATTVKHLSSSQVTAIRVALPPAEQVAAIAAYLDRATAQLDALAAEAERAVALLRERRAALIAAAVTGAIDVRDVAPGAGVVGRSIQVPHLAAPVPQPVRALTTPPAPAPCAPRASSPSLCPASVRALIAGELIARHGHQPSFGRVSLMKRLFLAEAHANANELASRPERWAAGPYDADLIREAEASLTAAGLARVEAAPGRDAIVYRITPAFAARRADVRALLGDRWGAFDDLDHRLAGLNTRAVEAVATLYAVWNDRLAAGQPTDDDSLVVEFLTAWHPEKGRKFAAPDLRDQLDWMRRNGLTPAGREPLTKRPDVLGQW